MKKYGSAAFDFKVLAIFDRADAAAYHEQAAIVKFNTLMPFGYNLYGGAPGTLYAGTPSMEARAAMSAAHMGQHQSIESRRKISEGLKGRPVSPETRAKIGRANLGKHGALGCHRSLVERNHLSEINMGHPVSLEARAKMSASHMGQPIPAKVRANMVIAQRLRRAVERLNRETKKNS
jgi:hypothetical protein